MIFSVVLNLFFLQSIAWSQPSQNFKIPIEGNYEIQITENQKGFSNLSISQNKKSVFNLKGLKGSQIKKIKGFPSKVKNLGRFLKFFPVGPRVNNQEGFIAFFSEDQFNLIHVKSGAPPTLVFKRSLVIKGIKDYDGDGFFDILKSGARGKKTKKDNYAYDPFLVYRQERGTSGETLFKADETLSKKWTTENNFQWYGSNYDEIIRVTKKGDLIK